MQVGVFGEYTRIHMKTVVVLLRISKPGNISLQHSAGPWGNPIL